MVTLQKTYIADRFPVENGNGPLVLVRQPVAQTSQTEFFWSLGSYTSSIKGRWVSSNRLFGNTREKKTIDTFAKVTPEMTLTI